MTINGISRKGGVKQLRYLIGMMLVCCAAVSWQQMAFAIERKNVDEHIERVDVLLAKAERALAVDRLTTPATDNAIKYIEQALAVAPEHAGALALLEEVVARYEQLVEKALKRGENEMSQGLQRALTYRARARRVASEHRLPRTTSLAQMDDTIASGRHLRLALRTPKQIVGELVDRHLVLANNFLDKSRPEDAMWHAQQVAVLASRYGFTEPRLTDLRAKIGLHRPALESKTDAQRATQEDTHQRFTELAAFYMAASATARDRGDLASAARRQQAAKEVIDQYGLRKDVVHRLAAKLHVDSKVALRPALFRVYGTF